MRKVFGNLWEGWKRFAHKLGRAQTVVLLTLFYFIVVAPFGCVLRVFGWDPLQTGSRSFRKPSSWQKVADGEPDLNSMRRQS